jgi:hypothetical protein
LEKIREEIKEEKFRDDAMRATVDVGKNIIEVSDEQCLRLCGHLEKMPDHSSLRRNLEWELEVTGRKGERKRDGWSKTEYN